MTDDVLRDRIASVCAALAWTQAVTPFSFDLQPSGMIDQVFRIESTASEVIGGFNYSEERTDRVDIWIARKYNAEPDETYRSLQKDISSIRAAVIRDGTTSGEYIVPSAGWAATVQREAGREFAVARVTMPCNYETTV